MSEGAETTAELEDLLSKELFGAATETEAPPEDSPEVVEDAPPTREAPTQPSEPTPEAPQPEPEEGEQEEEPEEEGDPNVVWATKKYGEDPQKWAKAARDQESYITRLAEEKKASDELAVQWYEYAQQQEQQQAQLGQGLPLSAQEEQYAENSLTNPLEYARRAAFDGRTQLYHAVIARVAEENPQLAAQIGTQVQMDLQQWAQAQAQQQAQPSLQESLGSSFQRLGIDLKAEGPRMSEKLNELGEYHPYVRAILNGNDGERDLAVQAVYDLTRASSFSARQVEREQAVAREEELRHEAAVVQTGGIQPPAPPRNASPLEQGMLEEWQRSGAWPYPEE